MARRAIRPSRPLFRRPLLLLTCSLALPLAGAAVAQEDSGGDDLNRLSIDLLLEMETVSTPRRSPDGSSIVFTRTWVDQIHDRTQSELWIMDPDGSRPRFLTAGSSARFSPNGARIAFLKEGKPKGTQIHVMWIDTREVTQITRVHESPSSLRWSPDGTRIAFQAVVPEKDDFLSIDLPKRPKGAEWAEDPRIITRLAYRRDHQGYRPAGFHHLFVVDANGGTARQVTEGDFDHRGGEWTPDGEALVFSGLREEDADWQVRESEIYAVHVKSGEVTQLTTRKGPDRGPKVSPDGRHIAYTGSDHTEDTYEVSVLSVMDADGGNPRPLTANLDRDPSDVMWAADSSHLYFTANNEGKRHLYRADLGGAVEQLSWGDLQFRATDVSDDGQVLGTLTAPHLPGDVATIQPFPGMSSPFNLLTSVNDDVLEDVTLGEVEEIVYPSAEGYYIQGWIIKPPDFDPSQKYPLILQIHGGPHGMYGVGFNFERQNHAAEGYVVLYTNPRGSTGYGKVFGNAINHAYPGLDYDDLMNGVDAVIEKGYVDEQNLYVYGGSGGGVLTCWIVGKTDRFASAVSMFPVTNWISFVGTTDGPYWYHNFEKRPWEDITEHWERSPLRLVGNVTTPTLLLTGELDLRTPMAQTEEFYQALKYRKVDTAMIRVPDEYHGAGARHYSNRLRRILYVREWFEKYRTEEETGDEMDAMEVSGGS